MIWMDDLPLLATIKSYLRFSLAALIMPVLLLASCGGDNPASSDNRVAPVISSVSSTVISPGDTLVINGSHFADQAGANEVIFNARPAVAVPFAATQARIDVVVPGNAVTGNMWVEVDGLKSNGIAMNVYRVVTIDSISSALLSPGQVIVIYGNNFAADAALNAVHFNNALAVSTPYSASSSRLELCVPENAASGPLWVESYGTKSDSCIVEITRGIGDVWEIAGENLSYTFKVKSTSGNEVYLIIPHSAAEYDATFNYTINLKNANVFPVPGALSSYEPRHLDAQEKFTVEARRKTLEYLRSRFPRSMRPSLEYIPQRTPRDTRNFYVLNTNSGSTVNPANFTQVTAALRYTGSKCLVYGDQNMPPGGFTQADYDSFGMEFDQSIFITDSTYFGGPTDINRDDHVVILFTPVVNGLTPPGTAQNGFYAGFFLVNDLLPASLPPGTSNGMEIFYAMVPDSTGQYGNVFTRSQVKSVTPKVLAHEFEHMISFGFRLYAYGTGYLQEVWLEEGMAHMAEDLNGMNGDNIKRANYFLPDPGAVSLMGSDTIEQRGAIYLFLRYLGDQLGEGIYRRIVQNPNVGISSVEYVTGEDFFASFSDWLATLYLSNRGITSDPKFNYTSINLQGQGFVPLGVGTKTVAQASIADSLHGSSGDFFKISGSNPPGIELTIVPSLQAAKLRVTVVRIQ